MPKYIPMEMIYAENNGMKGSNPIIKSKIPAISINSRLSNRKCKVLIKI